MMNIAIVAITYNRPRSLYRLLSQLIKSNYSNDKVDLIISIDKSEVEDSIIAVAEEFQWDFGNKLIRRFHERQGLRNHVLQCGDYALEYDAVIIFEDDIIPAENYYIYTKMALEYYNLDERIAGISLYSPMINEMAEKPFLPLTIDADVFFMKSAQSWGQCWSQSMWRAFRKWYFENSEELQKKDDMPKRIYSWPNSSWKKYYMKYLVEENKYFVYPYVSLSTNASEVGQHVKKNSSRYQVPLFEGKKEYKFISLDLGIIYDVFLENEKLATYLNVDSNNLCVDLYGTKVSNQNKRFVLTRKIMNFNILNQFGLSFKPHEKNVILNNYGEDIYLYDLGSEKKIILKDLKIEERKLEYYSSLNWKDSLIYGIQGLKDTIIRKILFR